MAGLTVPLPQSEFDPEFTKPSLQEHLPSHLVLASVEFGAGRSSAGEKLIRDALQDRVSVGKGNHPQDSGHEEGRHKALAVEMLAKEHARQLEMAEARTCYERGLEELRLHSPADIWRYETKAGDTFLRVAQATQRSDAAEAAVHYLRSAVEHAPKDESPWDALGKSLMLLTRTKHDRDLRQEALEAFENANNEAGPHKGPGAQVRASINLAGALVELAEQSDQGEDRSQQLAKAIDILQHWVASLSPSELSGWASAQVNLGMAWAAQKKLKAALKAYDAALPKWRDPVEKVRALVNSGTICTELGQYREAHSRFDKALKLLPPEQAPLTAARVLHSKGQALLKQGVLLAEGSQADHQNPQECLDQAISCFDRARELRLREWTPLGWAESTSGSAYALQRSAIIRSRITKEQSLDAIAIHRRAISLFMEAMPDLSPDDAATAEDAIRESLQELNKYLLMQVTGAAADVSIQRNVALSTFLSGQHSRIRGKLTQFYAAFENATDLWHNSSDLIIRDQEAEGYVDDELKQKIDEFSELYNLQPAAIQSLFRQNLIQAHAATQAGLLIGPQPPSPVTAAIQAAGSEVTQPLAGTATAASPQAPTAEFLRRLKLKERREFLDSYYKNRTLWVVARGDHDPTPADLLAWADRTFPDRRELGLVLSDLRHLDKSAYEKVNNWARPNTNGSSNGTRSDHFGFPSKVEFYDPESLLRDAPSGAEVFDAMLRGDPSAPALNRRLAAARYHKRKSPKP